MINKRGLTIAEAVISMVLLAIITMGIYGVIMASVRSGKKPDMREDMAYAIETASAELQGLLQNKEICVKWKPKECDCQAHPDCICCTDWRNCCEETQSTVGEAGYNDLCGRSFNGEGSYFARSTNGTGAQVQASTPFDENVRYYIDFQHPNNKKDLCKLPESCDASTSSFFYTVKNLTTPPAAPRYNIKFFISCNGQTMTNG